MKRYVLTDDAERDLARIVDLIAEDRPNTALKVFDRFHSAMRRLANYPGIGHTRDDIADESLRVWSVHKWLIIYRPLSKPLEVIRILHGARDIAAILNRRGAQ
jgi:plasmid stabilization system protein ParE